jgi:FkbM family methyltransferase
MQMIKNLMYYTSPWIYNRIRELKFSRAVKRFQPRIVEHCYGGDSLKVLIKDPLAEGWYDHDWETLGEIEILSKNGLAPGATVFDLGAHQNVVAMMLAKRVGPTGRVIAIEGSGHNVLIGRENTAQNGLSNIITVHAAAADKIGVLEFSESFNGNVSQDFGGFLQKTIRAVTIDSLTQEFGTPHVVFVDIEGHEIAALRGATQTLQAGASWFIELHGDQTVSKYGSKNADVFDFFPNGWNFLCRTDELSPFLPIRDKSEIPGTRCFLIAIPQE